MKQTINNTKQSIMKKYLFIAAVAVAAMACSKVDVNDTTPDVKVTFQAAKYVPQTKADTPASLFSESIYNFPCMAFLHADGYESETQLFFGENGETISAYTSNNVATQDAASIDHWAPSHDYYWPKSAESYVNFVAWYDKNGAPSTKPSASNESTLVWTFDGQTGAGHRTLATDDNILFADKAWHYNQNTSSSTNNSMYNTANSLTGENQINPFGQNGVTAGVPLLFHHALAKLCLKAKVTKVSEGNTTWVVTLSNIKFTDVYTTGTLSLTNTEPSASTVQTQAWTGDWSFTGQTPGDLAMTYTDALTASDAVLLPEQSILPQALTSVHLQFDYNISYKYNNNEYAHEKISADIPLTDFSPEVSSWAMNHKITYAITINPETTVVKIDPAMITWVDDGTATYSSTL